MLRRIAPGISRKPRHLGLAFIMAILAMVAVLMGIGFLIGDADPAYELPGPLKVLTCILLLVTFTTVLCRSSLYLDKWAERRAGKPSIWTEILVLVPSYFAAVEFYKFAQPFAALRLGDLTFGVMLFASGMVFLVTSIVTRMTIGIARGR